MVNSSEVSASVATRARIVLWRAEGRQKVEVAALAGVSRPTVDLWLCRFDADGVAGLLDRPVGRRGSRFRRRIRARILAMSKTGPPVESGLSHWSSRDIAAFINRTEGVYVSHHYVAKLWRETGLKPHHRGTFKVSKDPAFAEKVADVVGLYLEPPGGAVGSRSTRSPRSRPWTGPTGTADHLRRDREAHPRLCAARHDEPVRRIERGHRRGVRGVQAHPHRGELPRVPEEGGQAARR